MTDSTRHREQNRASKKRYYEAHKDEIKEYNKKKWAEWSKTHKRKSPELTTEERKIYYRTYYLTHIDQIRKYYQDHKERLRAYGRQRYAALKAAREAGVDGATLRRSASEGGAQSGEVQGVLPQAQERPPVQGEAEKAED